MIVIIYRHLILDEQCWGWHHRTEETTHNESKTKKSTVAFFSFSIKFNFEFFLRSHSVTSDLDVFACINWCLLWEFLFFVFCHTIFLYHLNFIMFFINFTIYSYMPILYIILLHLYCMFCHTYTHWKKKRFKQAKRKKEKKM